MKNDVNNMFVNEAVATDVLHVIELWNYAIEDLENLLRQVLQVSIHIGEELIQDIKIYLPVGGVHHPPETLCNQTLYHDNDIIRVL